MALAGESPIESFGFPGPENGAAVNVKLRVCDPVFVTVTFALMSLPDAVLQSMLQAHLGGHSVSGISQQGRMNELLPRAEIWVPGKPAEVTRSWAPFRKSRAVAVENDTNWRPSSAKVPINSVRSAPGLTLTETRFMVLS